MRKTFVMMLLSAVVSAAYGQNDTTYAKQGFSYLKKGDDKNALIALNKAIDLNGNYAWAYGLRGYLYTKLDAPELSYNDFSTAIALNAKDTSDNKLVQRARRHEEKDKNNKAAKNYRKALTADPENVDAFYGLQDLYLHKGVKQPLSKDTITDTTMQFPGQLYATHGTAFSTVEERYALMIKDYTKVISLYPEIVAAYRDRGYLYIKLNKPDSAITDLTTAIKLGPQPSMFFNRGLAYYNMANYGPAIQDFSAYIAMDSANASAYRYRGNLYTYVNKPELAIEDLNKSVRLDPKQAESYAVRGLAYALAKDYKKAIDDFTSSIRLNSGSATVYANRALAYKYQKDYKAAIKDFTTAIKLDPNDAEAYKARGEVYEVLGNAELAEADFKKAAGM
jgi:tetratricopeptide (TPR) repeat protein